MAPPNSSPTILVADDEPTVRTYIRNVLRVCGYRVIEAADGVEALDLVTRQRLGPDLLVTDIRMPRMDGVALARSLSSHDYPTPVVFVSGYPLDLDGSGLDPRQARAFVAKPFTRATLLAAVQKCLSSHPGASAG